MLTLLQHWTQLFTLSLHTVSMLTLDLPPMASVLSDCSQSLRLII